MSAPDGPPAVVMYTRSWCPYCERARELLEHKGVAFQEIDIETQAGSARK
jgi:glutaredoxin